MIKFYYNTAPNPMKIALFLEEAGLPYEAIPRTLSFVDKLPDDAPASMQRDLLDGKPSELEAQTGAIVRLAAPAGVPVPVNAFLYAALLPSERLARSR